MNAAPDLDRMLAALADGHRRQIIALLRARPHRAGELAQAIGLSPPALSRHLRQLKESGWIEEQHPEFDARVRIYSLRPQPVDALKTWLRETETLWAEQLLALKAHVDAS